MRKIEVLKFKFELTFPKVRIKGWPILAVLTEDGDLKFRTIDRHKSVTINIADVFWQALQRHAVAHSGIYRSYVRPKKGVTKAEFKKMVDQSFKTSK